MINNLEKILDYGGDDENGSYFCSLIISTLEGRKYVLHVGYSESSEKFAYKKIEFKDEESLKKAGSGYGLREWEETDLGCGYEITNEQYKLAMKEYKS